MAQRGTKKIKLKIQVKAKPQNNTKPADNKEPQDDTEQKEITWEEALKNGGEVYIIGITGDKVEFAGIETDSFTGKRKCCMGLNVQIFCAKMSLLKNVRLHRNKEQNCGN